MTECTCFQQGALFDEIGMAFSVRHLQERRRFGTMERKFGNHGQNNSLRCNTIYGTRAMETSFKS